jgi:hypothetical protein
MCNIPYHQVNKTQIMVAELVSKYGAFSDALISELRFRMLSNPMSIDITLECMNILNGYEYETLILSFCDVVSFQFSQEVDECSIVVFSALLTSEDDLVLVDFFPLIFGPDRFKENDKSSLKIKCKKLSYTKLEKPQL